MSHDHGGSEEDGRCGDFGNQRPKEHLFPVILTSNFQENLSFSPLVCAFSQRVLRELSIKSCVERGLGKGND